MSNKLYDETSIQNIANAIRNKNGSSDSYTVGQMAQAILNIPAGGGISEPLWDSSQIISGEYVNNNNGSFVSDNSAARSPLVEVTEDKITVFTASDWNNIYNAWYDASQAFISSFSLTRGGTNTGVLEVVTRPTNAKYVCLSNGSASMQNIRVWEGDIT